MSELVNQSSLRYIIRFNHLLFNITTRIIERFEFNTESNVMPRPKNLYAKRTNLLLMQDKKINTKSPGVSRIDNA